MGRQRRSFTKRFKEDAVRYRNSHPELTVNECAANLGVGLSSLQRWLKEYCDNPENRFRGSGNYESEEAKENARLRRENRDLKDALEVLKKAISILGE